MAKGLEYVIGHKIARKSVAGLQCHPATRWQRAVSSGVALRSDPCFFPCFIEDPESSSTLEAFCSGDRAQVQARHA